MKTRYILSLAVLGLMGIILNSCNQTKTDEEIRELALKIHGQILTIDTHNDTPMRFNNEEYNMGESHDSRDGGGKMDFPRMVQGGLDGAFFAVFTGQGERDEAGNERAYQSAKRTFESIYKTLEKHQDLVGLALTPDDAYALEKEGKRALFIGIENGYPIGRDINKVQEFYDLGARYITLCHTRNNDICDSSTDSEGPVFHGLSPFGEQIVDKMNELGIMIDISHTSDESFYDVIERSKAPIIASHSSVREICDNPRNLDDDMIRALAENGGVIQICILSAYVKEPEPNPARDSAQAALRLRFEGLTEADSLEQRELSREFRSLGRKYPSKMATVADAVDHIDHVVQLVGVDHVGIGTDFDGGGGIEDCFDVTEMPNITTELVRRGYNKKEIEKIWGGNIMRVLSEVEGAAGK